MRFGSKLLVAAPPDGRALWLRHDGSSIHLMASTCFIPAGLVLPVDDCFEVRVQRVDRMTKCLFVRPLCNDEQYDQLTMNLSAVASEDPNQPVCRAASLPLSMSTVYMLQTEKGYLRAVLMKREQTSTCLMYGIDVGEVYDVNSSDVRELSPSLRGVPPLCFCVVLESCSNTNKCEEFLFFEEGTICICKICNEFPSNYPQRAKEMYPPAIMAQIYEKNDHGKFVEVICTMKVAEKTPQAPLATEEAVFSRTVEFGVSYASVLAQSIANRKNNNNNNSGGNNMPRRRCRPLVVKSASVPAITRDPSLPFMFQKFNVSLPAHLTARVTERIDYDTYLMRNPEVLGDIEKRMVTATTSLAPRSCLDRGVCCIARLIRPARANCSTFQPQMYRAIASHYRPDDRSCEVILVDFGQTVVCNVSDLFELNDQPAEVLETPTASFRCRVKRFSPSNKNGNKTIKLLDENDYSVCLTLKCERDLYWAKVTLSETDFVLYYKKPVASKEPDEKASVEAASGDAQSQINENMTTADIGQLLERQRVELQEEEERLNEQEEMLRKEREDFANESAKREQELQLLALQMQLWDISNKLDMVASNSCTGFTRPNTICSPVQQGNYPGVPMCVINGYGQPGIGIGYGNVGNNAMNGQQQQNLLVNQSVAGQQLPYYLPAPSMPGAAPSMDQCNQQFQQMPIPNGMQTQMSCVADIPAVSYANTQDDPQYTAAKYCRNMNGVPNVSPQKYHSSPKQWEYTSASPSSRPMLPSDTSSDSMNGNGHPVKQPLLVNDKTSPSLNRPSPSTNPSTKQVSTSPKTTLPTPTPRTTSSMVSNSSTDCGASASADSFWNSCRRKLEYGEPPRRTVSDYCNIAEKQAKQTSSLGSFPERSMSTVSQYGKRFAELPVRQSAPLKLKNPSVAGDLAKGMIGKPVYTSDESSEGSEVCLSASNYQQQDMRMSSSERQLSLHFDSDPPSLPTYQMLHEFISIADGSELIVRRVGSDSDWPVFFVTPNAALQDLSAEYFDSLYPTQKLNASEIGIGVLCAVQCNGLGGAKVRAVIERFNENVVDVRHIDHGHVETIRRNELWSVKNLPPSVRTHPALAVPCILASLSEMKQLDGAVRCGMNEVPPVGQLMRVFFKGRRASDGVWIVELIHELNEKVE